MPFPPAAGHNPNWRFLSQKQHPERWLPYMVSINSALERAGSKLLSPLPQRTSFVPSHIRLDTAGLIDILVADADDTLLLKAKLEGMDMPASGASSVAGPSSAVEAAVPTKYELPGILVASAAKKAKGIAPTPSKAQLYIDLTKLVSPRLVDRVKLDPALQASAFKTAIWRCLTKLGATRHATTERLGMVFNNVIDTDGYSVCVHYVTPSLYGLTRFNGGFAKLKASQKAQVHCEKAKGATYATSLPEQERVALLDGAVLAADPGKGRLLCVTDGKGKVVSYSGAQRRVESGARAHAKEQQRLLRVRPGEGRTAQELVDTIGRLIIPGEPDVVRSSKSTIQGSYEHYLLTRWAVSADLTRFYRRTVFRAHRYDAFIGRRASEDRFFSKMKSTFGDVAVVLYGDWGRAPNIPHQPPSPGVGLRRRMCSYFKVVLTHEAYTSSLCPRCQSRGLTHPRKDRNGRDIHHLLKCPNGACSCRWWHRDILGALNILRTGKHALRTGQWDPTFAAAAPAA